MNADQHGSIGVIGEGADRAGGCEEEAREWDGRNCERTREGEVDGGREASVSGAGGVWICLCVALRRHHYEQAFEEYLRRRRIPYVAVDEAKKALLPRGAAAPGDADAAPALKSFDFVVYGQSGNVLAEVKGRRVVTTRMECWVTREDVESLARWERLFGPGFDAAFVFVYWFDGQPPDGLFQEVFAHGDRWYALRTVRVGDYARAMRVRSRAWGTIDLSRESFERLSAPFAPSPSSLLVGDCVPALEAMV